MESSKQSKATSETKNLTAEAISITGMRDVDAIILSYLSPQDLSNMRLVSKGMRENVTYLMLQPKLILNVLQSKEMVVNATARDKFISFIQKFNNNKTYNDLKQKIKDGIGLTYEDIATFLLIRKKEDIRLVKPLREIVFAHKRLSKEQKNSLRNQIATQVAAQAFDSGLMTKKGSEFQSQVLITELQATKSSKTNLSGMNLTTMKLSEYGNFIMTSAFLIASNLGNSNISRLNFETANLTYANLANAICINTNFRLTNLSHTNLSHADFTRANLIDANLIGANLIGANFKGANLRGTRFIFVADQDCLDEAKLIANLTRVNEQIHGKENKPHEFEKELLQAVAKNILFELNFSRIPIAPLDRYKLIQTALAQPIFNQKKPKDFFGIIRERFTSIYKEPMSGTAVLEAESAKLAKDPAVRAHLRAVNSR